MTPIMITDNQAIIMSIAIGTWFGIYLLSRFIGSRFDVPRYRFHQKAIQEQQMILININYAATDEELVDYEDKALDFFSKYNRLLERELLTYLTGQLTEAICNRKAKLNRYNYI